MNRYFCYSVKTDSDGNLLLVRAIPTGIPDGLGPSVRFEYHVIPREELKKLALILTEAAKTVEHDDHD